MHLQFARPIAQGDGAGVAWTSALESSKAARKCRPPCLWRPIERAA